MYTYLTFATLKDLTTPLLHVLVNVSQNIPIIYFPQLKELRFKFTSSRTVRKFHLSCLVQQGIQKVIITLVRHKYL